MVIHNDHIVVLVPILCACMVISQDECFSDFFMWEWWYRCFLLFFYNHPLSASVFHILLCHVTIQHYIRLELNKQGTGNNNILSFFLNRLYFSTAFKLKNGNYSTKIVAFKKCYWNSQARTTRRRNLWAQVLKLGSIHYSEPPSKTKFHYIFMKYPFYNLCVKCQK